MDTIRIGERLQHVGATMCSIDESQDEVVHVKIHIYLQLKHNCTVLMNHLCEILVLIAYSVCRPIFTPW